MANQTLMTPQLVLQYSSAKKLSADHCSFNQIHEIEFMQARRCIGYDLWTSMLAIKKDYSEEPTWVEGASVPAGEFRLHKGIAYKAIQATTNQPPYAGDWEIAPIFDEDEDCGPVYETFFCNHLAPYLAHTILFRRMPFMDQVEFKDKRVSRADDQNFRRAVQQVANQRATAWANLLYYMRLEAQVALQSTCFAGWRGVDDDDCQNDNHLCKPRNMRVGGYEFG